MNNLNRLNKILVGKILQSAVGKIQNIQDEPIELLIVEPMESTCSLQEISKAVSEALQVSEEALKGQNRSERIKDARHLFCYLAREAKCYTVVAIGEFVQRDYTTVLYACKTMTNLIKIKDEQIVWKLNKCRVMLSKIKPA